ncbi:MAG: diguanylate cyclase [Lysobacterales bacterium]
MQISQQGEPIRLLLADHPNSDRNPLISSLSQCGLHYELTVCHRPAQFAEVVSSGDFSAILLDHDFVGRGTYCELSDTLQQHCGARPPVVVLSENEDQECAAHAIAHGAQGFLLRQHLTPAGLRAGLELAFNQAGQAKAAMAHEQSLWHHSLHDGLTGLANRHLFTDRLNQELRHAQRNESIFAVVTLDLDRFRLINENCGQMAGDEVLCEVADRMQSTVRQSDTLARMGGNQFSVLLPAIGGPLQATRVAEKLRRTLTRPYPVGEYLADPGVSVGIALYPQHAEQAPQLLRRSELAMFDAKGRGGGVLMYAAVQRNPLKQRSELERDLGKALSGLIAPPEIRVAPQICLDSGACTGGQVSLRWPHPDQGLVPADTLHRLADRADLTETLTVRLLDQTLAHLANRQGPGPELTLCLPPQVLTRPAMVELIARRLAANGSDPSAVKLDFDETAAIHHGGAANPVLQRLAGLGLKISISGVGGSLSSLQFLRDFPLAELRIHPQFVGRLVAHRGDARMVGALVNLAQSLDATPIACGITDHAARMKLQDLGCTIGVGPACGRDMSLADFDEWRKDYRLLPLARRFDRPAANDSGPHPLVSLGSTA